MESFYKKVFKKILGISIIFIVIASSAISDEDFENPRISPSDQLIIDLLGRK